MDAKDIHAKGIWRMHNAFYIAKMLFFGYNFSTSTPTGNGRNYGIHSVQGLVYKPRSRGAPRPATGDGVVYFVLDTSVG